MEEAKFKEFEAKMESVMLERGVLEESIEGSGTMVFSRFLRKHSYIQSIY